MKGQVSGKPPEEYEPKRFWTRRVRRYVGIDDLGTVTSTGSPAFFNRFIHWLEGRTLKQILLHLPNRGLLLDLGCGYGRWFGLYQSKGVGVVGVDIVWDLVKRGMSLHPEVPFILGDARGLPFASGVFDGAITVKVLQFVPSEQQESSLHELGRVVKSGGTMVMLELTEGKAHGHIHPNTPSEWIGLARDAGFALVDWRGSHFVPVDRMLDRARVGIARMLRRIGNGKGKAVSSLSDVPDLAPAEAEPWRSRHSTFGAGYHSLRHLSTRISKALEPLVERTSPRGWASHGLFVFRKEGKP